MVLRERCVAALLWVLCTHREQTTALGTKLLPTQHQGATRVEVVHFRDILVEERDVAEGLPDLLAIGRRGAALERGEGGGVSTSLGDADEHRFEAVRSA